MPAPMVARTAETMVMKCFCMLDGRWVVDRFLEYLRPWC